MTKCTYTLKINVDNYTKKKTIIRNVLNCRLIGSRNAIELNQNDQVGCQGRNYLLNEIPINKSVLNNKYSNLLSPRCSCPDARFHTPSGTVVRTALATKTCVPKTYFSFILTDFYSI